MDGSLPLGFQHTWQVALAWFTSHEALLIFLAILLEESGIPMPLPADLAMALAGHRVAQGRMSLLDAFLIGQSATLAGSSILYWAGRRGGRPLLFRYGSILHLSAHRLAQAERLILRMGPLAIILGRQIPGLRLASPLACGVFRVRYRVFVPAMIVGSSVYIGAFLALGMWGGPAALGFIQSGGAAVRFVVSTVLLVGAAGVLRQLSRRAREVVPPAYRLAASHRRSLEAAVLAGLGASTLLALVMAWLLSGVDVIAQTPPDRALLQYLERSSTALPAIATSLGPRRVLFAGLIASIPFEVLTHLIWAILYAFGFEPRLRGSAGVRGLQFAALPWLFNGLILFPLLGAGPFAAALGTGALPAFGEVVRQAIFGISLGTLYRLIRLARQPRAHAGHRHGHRHGPHLEYGAWQPLRSAQGQAADGGARDGGRQTADGGRRSTLDTQSVAPQLAPRPALTRAAARYAALDTATLRRLDRARKARPEPPPPTRTNGKAPADATAPTSNEERGPRNNA